ncbi:FAD-dependent monooxygenase, partial [Nocardia abscessus]|uniref:FAD-dependent monooxygenase n=1 Tax=Nocardia abscessus TaxID=120957 RepID=UPI00313B00CA
MQSRQPLDRLLIPALGAPRAPGGRAPARRPEGNWHNADTVLIGDAAHAVSPAAGRGATSAIEDAIVLAKTLRSG